MTICHEPLNKYAWVCLCGNTPTAEGFYPCNGKGKPVEPTPEDWTTNLYVCERCGRMIDADSFEVVGVREGGETPSAR